MKVLIAPDKFKGSLSAEEVCLAISKGLKKYSKVFKIKKLPMADGGDGSLEVLSNHLHLEEHFVEVTDPLGRPIKSSYLSHDKTAYIELAKASGLTLLSNDERNPMYTSSEGTGALILNAIENGFDHVVLMLGGSSTNDAGIGIAHALGFRFLDRYNHVLKPLGENLFNIKSILKPRLNILKNLQLDILCDVKNKMFGPRGAAFTYAKQKGANESQMEFLDAGLKHFAKVVETELNISISEFEGGGAAGAISAGLTAMLGGHIIDGFGFMSKQLDLESSIQNSDFIISGEGQLDQSSFEGKVIEGILNLSKVFEKKLALFVGNNTLGNEVLQNGLFDVKSIMDVAIDQDDAMLNGAGYLEKLAFAFAPLILGDK